MADLQTKSFQRESTPIYNKKAVQRDYSEPDTSIGQNFKNQQLLFDAASGFTQAVAGIVGKIDVERQKGIADDIIHKIELENLNNTVLIDNELPKKESSSLDPKEMMTNFAAEGINTDKGMIQMAGYESYEGYEFLDKNQKDRIKSAHRQSQILTQENIVKQIASLSRDHKNRRLDRKGVQVKNQLIGKLSNGKNYNKKTELAPYLKNFSDTPGPGDGPRGAGWRNYWIDQVIKGNKNVPGAPKGGSSIKDLPSQAGLKPEAKRVVDQILEEYTWELAEALENDHILETDVEDKLNTVMEFTLMEMFKGEYDAFPEQAIRRAKNGEYSYTRRFDQAGLELGTIKYQLDPAKLQPYLERHNRLPQPKTDPFAYELEYMNLQKRLKNKEVIHPFTYGKNLQATNPKINAQSIGSLMRVITSHNIKEGNEDQRQDKNLIIKQFETKLAADPEFIYEFATPKGDGTYEINMDSVLKNIPGIETSKEVFSYDMYGKGKRSTEAVVTKGSDRIGSHLITKSEMQSFVLEHVHLSRKHQQEGYVESKLLTMKTQAGRDDIFSEFALYEGGEPTNNLDIDRIESRWNEDPYLKRAYPTLQLFLTDATKILRQTFNAETASVKPAKRHLTLDTPANLNALEKAIIEDSNSRYDEITDVAFGQGDRVRSNYSAVDELLQRMKDNAGDQTLKWEEGSKAAKMIAKAKNSHGKLYAIHTEHPQWTLKELQGTSVSLLPDNNPEGTVYSLNKKYANHIRGILEDRISTLTLPVSAARLIRKEIKTSTVWHQKLGYPPDVDHKVLEDAICDHLGIPRTRKQILSEVFDGLKSVRNYDQSNPDRTKIDQADESNLGNGANLNRKLQHIPISRIFSK